MTRGKPKDYYKILGIQHDATGADIKHAFRALAKRYHPDHNPGDKRAEEYFKMVQEAYGVLSDRDKKSTYDHKLRVYETVNQFRREARTTTPRGTNFERRADGTFVRRATPPTRSGSWFSKLFGDMEYKRRITKTLSFEKAFRGGPVTILVPQDKPVRVTLPEDIRDGYAIRIKDVTGPPLHVTFKVAPHESFRMKGNDLVSAETLQVGAMAAMLGKTFQVAHPSGTPVSVTVPPGTQPGATLRVRGKGVRGGDMVLKVSVLIPNDLTIPQRKALHHAAKAAGLL